MNWDAIGAIAELIGGIGVIATLGYLAAQIRNSNRQDNIRAVQDTVKDFVNTYAELTDTRVDAEIFAKGLQNFEALDQADKAVFHSKMQLLASGFYQVLAMKESGLLTDLALFEKSESLFLSMLASPGGNAWWQAYRHLPPETLRQHVEQRITEIGSGVAPAHEDQIWYRQP